MLYIQYNENFERSKYGENFFLSILDLFFASIMTLSARIVFVFFFAIAIDVQMLKIKILLPNKKKRKQNFEN